MVPHLTTAPLSNECSSPFFFVVISRGLPAMPVAKGLDFYHPTVRMLPRSYMREDLLRYVVFFQCCCNLEQSLKQTVVS